MCHPCLQLVVELSHSGGVVLLLFCVAGDQSEQVKKGPEMDTKSMELKYDSLMNQLMSATYFLINFGVKMNQATDIDIEHKSMESSGRYVGHYTDDFYRSLNDLTGLTRNGLNENDAIETMDKMVDCALTLLELKMIPSQDMLILCWLYCLQNEENKSKLSTRFIKVLNEAVNECLESQSNSSSKSDDEKESWLQVKARNYLWFKTFLLRSNIWLMRRSYNYDWSNVNEQSTDESKSNSSGITPILFDTGLKTVNMKLENQKKFIWDNIKDEEKNNGKLFDELVAFGNGSLFHPNKQLRQDGIVNGIMTKYDEIEMITKAIRLNIDSNNSDNFDLMFETNTKSYLTQCLLFAHVNNGRFQKEMGELFNNVDKYGTCQYQGAPVKLNDRCLIKCTSDYAQSEYPSAACILVEFNNVKSVNSVLCLCYNNSS